MADELVDLTKLKPSEAASNKTDLIILVTMGGVGYLAREAFKYFFPGVPSLTEQLEGLTRLVEACARAGAKTLKVRLSVDAKRAWHVPVSVKEMKIVGEADSKVDLEIAFA